MRKQKTFASALSGGCLADVGAVAAGYRVIWGIELDPEIASVAHMNGFKDVIVANILDVDPRTLEVPDLFHFSPVCTNASVANSSAELNEDGLRETKMDIAVAEKLAEFIRVLKSRTVTFENVQGYRKFKSFKILIRALADCGYMYTSSVENAANYGVPQSRRRLIVRAVLGGMVPMLPSPVKHVGWYSAIEDILDTLPESHFAAWQEARLPNFFGDALFTPNKREEKLIYSEGDNPSNTITSNRNQLASIRAFLAERQLSRDGELDLLPENDPAMTLVSSEKQAPLRAFLANTNMGGDENENMATADDGDPAFAVTPSAPGRLRAFLSDSLNYSSKNPNRMEDEPALTVVIHSDKHPSPRAFLVDGDNGGKEGPITHPAPAPAPAVSGSSSPRAFLLGDQEGQKSEVEEPSFTVRAGEKGGAPARAFLVDGKPLNYAGELSVTDAPTPAPTLTASQEKHPFRGWLSKGRVVSMTPRALARFQSVPDTYILPEKRTLAGKIIGNGYPPLMMEKIFRCFDNDND